MPAQIVVSMEPVSPSAIPPPQTGPAVNAAFLKAVGAVDPVLAKGLHDSARYKPFTVTPVLDEQGRAPTTAGQSAWFGVSMLVDGYTAVVLAALHAFAGHQIAWTRYRVTGVRLRAQPYAELAASADAAADGWSFQLVTPVGFATGLGDGARRERPWPDAERVFGNLARRWEAFAAGSPLPASVAAAIDDHLEMVDGQVRIVRHLIEPQQRNPEHQFRRGTVGVVSYRLASAREVPVEARRGVDALARFAGYAGFGDRTAMGMGYVRLRPSPGGRRGGGSGRAVAARPAGCRRRAARRSV
ncbi:CRISPR system precrRNA processing endoribonuclease RAMP protein Cas6 [Micromonospora rifamycinica]|uniref:CRISPR system precrRNA processing endoribonuclease RAMP protein Cas6 n=1 Tax=Micromonospora rifamycinica TaxID=291594 RepID=UPI003408BBF7